MNDTFAITADKMAESLARQSEYVEWRINWCYEEIERLKSEKEATEKAIGIWRDYAEEERREGE